MRNPYKLKLQELGLPYRRVIGEASAKTIKGQNIGYLTGIVYLSPDDDICALAKLAGCMAGCLRSAGRGAFDSVQNARAQKTEFFKTNPQAYMLSMAADVWSLVRKAKSKGMTPLVRPNGTSDIPFENIIIEAYGLTIFQLFGDVQFYDYTKHPSRKLAGKTAGNYDLTYSFSGVTPKSITDKGLANPDNSRAAVVFHRQADIPATFRGWPVVDGDETDVRHIEPRGVMVALYAKGKAKADLSGFVQHAGRDYPIVMMRQA